MPLFIFLNFYRSVSAATLYFVINLNYIIIYVVKLTNINLKLKLIKQLEYTQE